MALTGHRPDQPGFGRIEEQAAAVLRFPDERLASFTVSFGARGRRPLQRRGHQGGH